MWPMILVLISIYLNVIHTYLTCLLCEDAVPMERIVSRNVPRRAAMTNIWYGEFFHRYVDSFTKRAKYLFCSHKFNIAQVARRNMQHLQSDHMAIKS